MSGKARKFFIVFLFLLAGCARQGAPRDFTVAIESYPANLDPRYPNDAYSSKLQQLIFNGLLKFDEEMRLVPDLVEGYEYRSDTRLRLKLRAGVRFHDGHELSAKDVLYTFKSLMDPKKRSPLYDTFRRITEIDAVDDLTLEIELEEPFAPFLTALTVGIIPHGADEASPLPFAQRPVGTGPFQWVGARTDQWIRLKAFPDYFEGAPSIGGLQFKTIRDDTTRVLQLLRGEVDLVQNAVPLVMAEWLRQKTDLVMASDTGINYAYLAFNFRDPALQDRRVREAVALAIDRDKLIEHRLKGFAKKATGILAPSNWSYEKNVSQYDHNPERAKALLEEAGLKDPDGPGPKPRLSLTLKTSNKRDRVAMARAIAAQLKEVGIALEVRPYEWGTFFRDIKTGNFQMYSSTWVGVTEPDIYYYAFASSQFPPKGANRGFYSNPELDKLLEAGRVSTVTSTRKEIYSQVQKIISHDLPYVSLWYEDNVVFTRPQVEGYSLRPDASLLGLTRTKLEAKPPTTVTDAQLRL